MGSVASETKPSGFPSIPVRTTRKAFGATDISCMTRVRFVIEVRIDVA